MQRKTLNFFKTKTKQRFLYRQNKLLRAFKLFFLQASSGTNSYYTECKQTKWGWINLFLYINYWNPAYPNTIRITICTKSQSRTVVGFFKYKFTEKWIASSCSLPCRRRLTEYPRSTAHSLRFFAVCHRDLKITCNKTQLRNNYK